MNDFIRPALYDGWSDIVACEKRRGLSAKAPGSEAGAPEEMEREGREGAPVYTVAGPVCESGDFLGRGRRLDVAEGDLIAVCSAGAYGFVMSSNYNSRPRAAEVMVDEERAHPVRRRERASELYAGESRLPA